MLARKVLWLCCLLIFPLHSANAAEGPQRSLKGIKAILYATAVDDSGDRCKIDEDNLNTSVEFVANQSTNLKIRQYSHRRVDELISQVEVSSPADYGAARKAAEDYNLMPHLVIDITPLQVQSACAGTISATLWGSVKGEAHIYPTDAAVPNPSVVIWSKRVVFVGPQQTFSNQAINTAEQIMKKLVNDWAASQ